MDQDMRVTRDMGLAAYMLMNKLLLVKAKRLDNGRSEFVIRDPERRWPQLAVDWVNSEARAFDDQVRSLKKSLTRSNGG